MENLESVVNGATKSYEAHQSHLEKLAETDKEKRLFPLKNKNCVDYYLNKRTLELLQPFFLHKKTWLTIGDLCGVEANYLLEKGQQAHASDISDVYLKEAHSQGLIKEFTRENVEQLNFKDNAFDYVLCREAFHHFPRAYLGLYEMIRVSRKAAIIIEPIDLLLKFPPLLLLKNVLDWFDPLLINKLWKNRFSFEVVGNYVFKISEREIEKMAMGLGFRCIAFKGANILLDVKENTFEVPMNQQLLQKVQSRIRKKDLLCALKLIPYNTLCCVVFKEYPDAEVLDEMKRMKYKIIDLPQNPYLK